MQDHQLPSDSTGAPAPSATPAASSTASPAAATSPASDATVQEIDLPTEPEGDGVVADPSPPVQVPDTFGEEDRGLDTASAPASSSETPNIWAVVAAVLAGLVLSSFAVGCLLFSESAGRLRLALVVPLMQKRCLSPSHLPQLIA